MRNQQIGLTDNHQGKNLLQRADNLATGVAAICEKHWRWLLIIFSSIYFVAIGLICVRKPFENDELFTLNIARLPNLTEVWSALLTGAEQLPPFFYVLTRASLSLFGENNFALRFPAMLGFWVMSLCLFRFVAKRSTVLYGLVAMLFPLTTGAYYYSYEARPYGLVLGFTGLALVCWQSLAENRKRLAPMFGFTLSLAAAISCHYYSVLILIPFACGEIARAIKLRRVNFSIWAAMIVSLIPLLIFLPLINSAKSYSTAFWAQPNWGDAPYFYYFMLISAALPITATLILSAIYSTFSKDDDQITDSPKHLKLPDHETATAIGFLAIPFVAVALAMFVTRAFTHRYAIPATLGLGILVPLSFRWLLRGRQLLTLSLVILLMLGFIGRGGMLLQEADKMSRQRESAVRLALDFGEPGLPIVISDPHNFLILSHYAPPEIRERLIYLADAEASMRHLGHNSIERGMFDLLKPWFKLKVHSYKSYLVSKTPFLLIAESDNFLNWILSDLPGTDRKIELRGKSKPFLLFLVKPAE